MKVACVTIAGRGSTDRLLAEVAARLEAKGLRLAGTVQTNLERTGRANCDMDIRVLPDGPILRISEDRGDLARGCRLDPGVLEQAVIEVQTRLDGAVILLVNKFGKRECEGKGLVPVIAIAIEQGLPVLLGVNGLNLELLKEFVGETLITLQPVAETVVDWCLAQTLSSAA